MIAEHLAAIAFVVSFIVGPVLVVAIMAAGIWLAGKVQTPIDEPVQHYGKTRVGLDEVRDFDECMRRLGEAARATSDDVSAFADKMRRRHP